MYFNIGNTGGGRLGYRVYKSIVHGTGSKGRELDPPPPAIT